GLISLCDLPWVPIFLVVCFVFHPMIGWVATAGALIVFVLAFLNEFVTKRALSEAAAHGQSAQYFANTTLQNVEAIRALGMEGNLRGRWSQMHNDMLASQAVASDKAGALLSASRFVRMSLQIVILGVGAYLALEGAITPGVMIAASIMMGRALAPVDQIASQWKQFVAARAAYGRLKSLFATVEEEDKKTDLPEPKGAVSAEGLTVAAPGSSTPIVKGVTFAVEPGDVMAIVGPSGAGKSSLIRALVGVWPPTGGAARLDGSELQHWDNDKLGRHFGYLPQTVELFAGTIAENIARFDEVDDARVVAAAEAANAHTLIQSLPDGYDTQIGPGGGKLSGGQRQRVGFARALYADPKVLILDEPNANLDSDGEEALARAITGLREQGRTVLFVSHKMSLIALSNKALLLKDGRMQAFGDTKDLLQPKMLKAVGDKAKLAAIKAAAGAA
ncbi:MAG: type I secretion system permease/ATPase, partial [Pseudomonadota bacterium]